MQRTSSPGNSIAGGFSLLSALVLVLVLSLALGGISGLVGLRHKRVLREAERFYQDLARENEAVVQDMHTGGVYAVD